VTCPLSANRDRTQHSKIHCLIDHFVGAHEQGPRHVEAKHLGS
jgi:hypothetical protein